MWWHCFAWEYKGKHKDLKAALRQLQQYALALENPQLLIVSDMETIEIHTNLGDKKQLAELGDADVETMRQIYAGRVPGGADLVCYWFEKARARIEAGQAQRAGLVATNSIRGGANRKVLERIRESSAIFNAWSDEPWFNEGAAVRVSLVCFRNTVYPPLQKGGMLNGQPVAAIHADLTGSATVGVDLTLAKPLLENINIAFQGPVKVGAFDISGEQARTWLNLPNPHGRSNSKVLRPWANGMDITRRPSDTWINDPTYNAHSCFETFPFPAGLQPNPSALSPTPLPHAGEGLHIAEAARALNKLRDNWLNPPQWIERAPEIVSGYPDRIIPKPEHAAELKKRTLTNLYNQRPAWLFHAHHALDEAVAAAYGWPVDLSDDETLRQLLVLNRERAGN